MFLSRTLQIRHMAFSYQRGEVIGRCVGGGCHWTGKWMQKIIIKTQSPQVFSERQILPKYEHKITRFTDFPITLHCSTWYVV